jgi:hypothetical protein
MDATPYHQKELADIWLDIFQDRYGFAARPAASGMAA